MVFLPTASGGANPKVSFKVQSKTRFSLEVEGQNPAMPFEIEIEIPQTPTPLSPYAPYVTTKTGDMFVATTVADAAGKDAPFTANVWDGCGKVIFYLTACTDAAVFKFSAAGKLVFASYLTGRTQEVASFVAIAPDGALVVTGSTDSDDFPVTAQAVQRVYGGPSAKFGSVSSSAPLGDFFAARLDPAAGTLLASTYFGRPNVDSVGQSALGADGSLYFFPQWLGGSRSGMPVSPGALQRRIAEPSCGCLE